MRKPDPVIIVATHIRLFAEGVSITLFIAMLAVLSVVLSGRLPA